MSKVKKNNQVIISLILAIACLFTYGIQSFFTSKQTINTQATVRTIEVKQNELDIQSVFDEFEDAKLETAGSLTTFEGVKTISIDDFSALDNLSESDIESFDNIAVKYNFSYDAETGIVKLSATTLNRDSVIEVEEIQGLAFYNDNGEIDAYLDVDGECVLLSEMQDAGMIANCGWFSRLFKKVVVAVVAVVVVSAVAAAVVATCGAGLGACIAAGAIAGGITGGIAGGVISYSEYGKLDWRWVAGGVVIGAAIGAITGWGVGSVAMKTPTAQTNRLIKSAKNGNLDFSNSIKNKSYFQKGSCDYRQYYEQTNLISQEIMKAKSPVVESGTNYLKWTVEGIQQTAKGTTYGRWELIIDPVKEVIVHFLFAS